MGQTKPKRRIKQRVGVTLTKELVLKLKTVADEQGTSVSNVIERCCRKEVGVHTFNRN